MRRQHERVCLWALVEAPEALARIGDIAAVRPGADVISVGRGDLSAALGLYGQIDHPDVIAAAERAIAEVRSRSNGDCISSAMVHSREDIAFWFEKGCRMFTYAADAILLMNAARHAVDAFRGYVPARGGSQVAS